MSETSTNDRLNRRGFLSGVAGLGGLAWAVDAFGLPLPAPEGAAAQADRLDRAFEIRRLAAEKARSRGVAKQRTNGDEETFPGGSASFSKGLPHDELGHVDPAAYAVLLRALRTGEREDFESIPLGGYAKLANPQAALAFDLLGPDGCQLELPPAPTLDSAELAAELVEDYWHALLRDVPFARYDSHPLVAKATEDLSRLSGFAGPKEGGRVTPDTLFRGTAAGALDGPLVSQFLWQPIPWEPMRIEPTIRTAAPGLDYLTERGEWLAIQNGALGGVNRFDPRPRYIRAGRDLGEYVHRDFTYQSYLGAGLAALEMGALPDGGNPYKHSHTQGGFATFGEPYLLYLLAVVTQVALKVCWYQKWIVHRRIRPEALAGRLANHLAGTAEYPFHRDLLESAALDEVQMRKGSLLLPQAYPEGCPTHPSYPAGHAVVAGACVTAIKAFLDENHEIPRPVVAAADGLSLEAYEGAPLAVGGELDKLAGNIAFGRDFAGVHYRSDGAQGLRLGEEVAIAVLEELSSTGNELFTGFSVRRFDGTRISVG